MSGPSKNTAPYSASDIQRYLKGEMSAREMHDLEKAALDDPFLADALEGYEMQQPAEPSAHLDDLRSRLNTRTAPKGSIVRLPLLRVAAAVILLIGLGYTAWYSLQGKSKLDVAKQVSPVTPPSPSPKADSASVALNEPAAQMNQPPVQENQPPAQVNQPPAQEDKAAGPAAAAEEHKTAPATASTPHYKAESAPLAKTTPAIDEATIPSSTSQARAYTTPPAIAPGLAVTTTDSTNYAPYRGNKLETLRMRDKGLYDHWGKIATIQPMVFSGKVLDIHNNPLSGAVLRLDGTTPINVVTDQNGYFSMKVPKDSLLKVTVGRVGYQQTSLAFNTLNTDASTGNLIHLQEQPNALDEVVVVGYGTKRKETRALVSSPNDEKLDSSWVNARPVIGKQAYLDYLDAGKKTIGADSSVKGTVIISFDVSKKGELTAFKVEQSLTPAHDAGVIHLISEGPSWKKLSKGKSVRAAVRVVF